MRPEATSPTAGRARAAVTATLVVAALVAAAAPTAGALAEDSIRMELRLNALDSPGYGHEGLDMPVYLGYSTNTRFEGAEEPRRLEQPLVSNTIAVPRSEWSPGEGADEFTKALGIVAGPFIPNPQDEFADSYYFWNGMQEGATAGGGDDINHLKVWAAGIDAYQVPHTPTGREGSFAWRHDPSWPNVLRGTTTSRSRVTLPDGTTVASPATKTSRAMYVNHGQLEVEGGDVDAAGGAVAAPTFAFNQETPPGTVMNVQAVGYSPTPHGPWGPFLDITPDFHTGLASAPTGEWRLPVDVTLRQGGFWPERSQPTDIAAPQYALALRTVGVPLLPEEAGPGANDVHLVSDLAPGETFVMLLALRQPDGSVETTRLKLDEPGRRVWRVEDGHLVEEPAGGPGYQAAGLAAEAPTGDAPEAPVTPAEGEPPADGFTIEVNEAGRPVARDVVRDGVRLADLVDLPRVHTPEGPVELGEHNRDGRAALWAKPSGDQGRGRAVYVVGDLFVLLDVTASSDALNVAVTTHSLSGEPIPHQIEAVATLGEAIPLDLLAGQVTRATRFLPSVLAPRLVLPTPARQFRFEPQSWDGAEVEIRNVEVPPSGEPLTAPEYVARITRPDVWGGVSRPVSIAAQPVNPPSSGEFTEVATYRLFPQLIGGPSPVGPLALEQTRDFDGYEQIAVTFRAERPDGTPIRRTDVTRLQLVLRTLDGRQLFSGTLTGAPFTPDDGTTWGAVLTPNSDLDPADVVVYARATHAGGIVTKEGSAVPAEQWGFRIDRIPVSVTSTEGGMIRGSTEPDASVSVGVPEVGIAVETTADSDGAFSAALDLSGVPGGDYEVAVRAVEPAPAEGKDVAASLLPPSPASGEIPEDDAGTATARLRHLPGGQDPSLHSPGPPVDREAAVAFLASREEGGAYDGSLRATAWAAEALGLPASSSAAYLRSLAAGGGYAWRAGEEPTAAATGFAAQAARAVGEPVILDPKVLLRWDGSADAGPGADASSLEGAALLVLALEAAGELAGLDPWWRGKIAGFLDEAGPRSPAERYARARALGALGVAVDPDIAGAELDAVAYRALVGAGSADDVAPYQLVAGGFTLRPDGDLPKAFPTALALAVSR